MSNAVATKEIYSVFADIELFKDAQRIAQLLASSNVIPQQFQNNIPNCVIALEMANRLKTSPIMVMQNLYVVHGRPSFSSQYIIGVINASRRFDEPLMFELSGEGDNRSCYCYTTKQGKQIKGPEVSIDMAKKEGWFGKSGSKWQTMPELMLQYRSASFFGRLYCADLIMGLQSREEVEEIAEAPQQQYQVYPNSYEIDPTEIMVEPEISTYSEPEQESDIEDQPGSSVNEPTQMNIADALGEIE